MMVMIQKPNYALENGLVDARRLLEIVWPDETCRPSLRTLRSWQKARRIPFLQIGRLIFFDPKMVREHLTSKALVKAKA